MTTFADDAVQRGASGGVRAHVDDANVWRGRALRAEPPHSGGQ